MYIVNIAVRWCATGELEGFGSSGLTEPDARQRALNKAYSKASTLPNSSGFDVLTKAEYDALSIEDQDTLQADWNMETL